MAKPQKLYWDTCAWIGLLNGEPDKKRELDIIYGHAKRGHFQIWTSTVSMVECRRVDGEKNGEKPLSTENDQRIQDMFRQSFVLPIPMAVDIAETARTLWRSTPGLGKWQDAVHLASALMWNIPVFHTYDRDDLLHLDGSFDCNDGSPLTICYPDQTTDGALFAKKGE